MTTKQLNKDSIINKVKRALALAQDNPNDSEGQTALTLAQRLMVKHDISMSEVSLEGFNDPKTKRVKANEHKRIAWWERDLAGIISNNFRCYYWWNTWNRGSVITFMGMEDDVELAKEVYSLSVEAVKFYANRFIKVNQLSGHASITRKYKNDYIRGFLQGLREKFKEQRAENEEWGLILQKAEQLVTEYTEGVEATIKEEAIQRPDLFSEMARGKGYEDGKKMDPTRKTIGGKSQG